MTLRNTERTVVDARASLLSFLLYEGRFEVPWHQRYYDWQKEHVAELLQDLDEGFRDDRECYFLGAVMLVEMSDSLWQINDGQQRMVTFSLLCARLARTFSRIGDTRREALALRVLFVLSETHTSSLSDSDDLTPRLVPPRNDKTRFNLLIRGKNIGTNGKLTTAWEEIDKYFSAIDVEKAKRMFDFLLNRLEVACLLVPRRLDPNSVFETLNGRGKALGDLDLLRNHFFSFFPDEKEDQRREVVHQNLENFRSQLGEGQRAEEYLRCYLQCRFGFLPKDRLYREAKSKLKAAFSESPDCEPSDYAFSLVEDLSRKDRVETFRAISSPGEEDPLIVHFLRDCRQSRSRRNLAVFLRELQSYKVSQPIVFAWLSRYVEEGDPDRKRWVARLAHRRLKLLTSFVMRTAFVAQKFEPSHFESEFAALAQMVSSTKALDAIPFVSTLRDSDEFGILEDRNFISRVGETTIRENNKAKRFLLGLAHYEEPDSIVINERRYTIEHVLPKSDKHLVGWAGFDAQTHSENVYCLGNLTLLSGGDNKPGDAANRSFSKKKEIYSNSAIPLTRELASIEEWSPRAIQRRQRRLAKVAAKVWDLPDVA